MLDTLTINENGLQNTVLIKLACLTPEPYMIGVFNESKAD